MVELVVWGVVVFGGDMFGEFLSLFVVVARNSPRTCLPLVLSRIFVLITKKQKANYGNYCNIYSITMHSLEYQQIICLLVTNCGTHVPLQPPSCKVYGST